MNSKDIEWIINQINMDIQSLEIIKEKLKRELSKRQLKTLEEMRIDDLSE